MARKLIIGMNDLASTYPDVTQEWNWIKNEPLKPDQVSHGSHKYVWWKCSTCGNEWQQQIYARTSDGRGCPECGQKKASAHRIANIVESRNLKKMYPELAKEWDYEKNGDLLPETVSVGSHKQVYWKCPKGHSYQARISNRVYKKDGCSYCSNRKILPGFNDLETVYPYLAEQWDYEKNKPLTPKDVSPCGGGRYYWICPICKESYSALLSNRVKGKGCKNCSKTGTSFPEQAVYYYIKNYFPDAVNRDMRFGFELDIFIPSLHVAVEYDGKRYHNSETAFIKDNHKNENCEKLGIKMIRFRDPSLKRMNAGCTIDCRDHDEKALKKGLLRLFVLLGKEVEDENGIDIERDRFTILSFSLENKREKSILYTHPEIASEWDYEKNSPLTPEYVSSGMGVKAYWNCKKCGCSYQTYVYSRTEKDGAGCPSCGKESSVITRRKKAAERNGLKDARPDLINEIDIALNPGLDISVISLGSQTKVNWKCSVCGYQWKTTVAARSAGEGCTICGRKRANKAIEKAVINIDTGESFFSLTAAAASCNGDKRSICNCCRGKTKTAYGCRWKYADDSDIRSFQRNWKVKNVETGELFDSISDAARSLGVDRSSISSAIRGKTKTSGGFHWKKIYDA